MISSQKKFQSNRSFLRPPQFPLKFGSDPFKDEKKLFWLWGSCYSNWPAWTHDFNAKIGFEKHAERPEILAKMCKILVVWFGRLIFDTFLVISWDSVHVFQNRFLRWKCRFEYHEPYNLKNFGFNLFRGPENFHVQWGCRIHFRWVQIYQDLIIYP